jgi:hypothetical protein
MRALRTPDERFARLPVVGFGRSAEPAETSFVRAVRA